MDVQDGSGDHQRKHLQQQRHRRGDRRGRQRAVLEGNSQVNITNSQFSGNLNSNLVAYDQSQVTAQGSTFSNSQKGDGAIFSDQATVRLTGNTFASNGPGRRVRLGLQRRGVLQRLHRQRRRLGQHASATTRRTGSSSAGASQAIQITGNNFINNLVGLNMDASVAPISAVIQGNTFVGALGSADQGLVAAGSGVTATVGGSGSEQNTFENLRHSALHPPVQRQPGSTIGCPNLANIDDEYLPQRGCCRPALAGRSGSVADQSASKSGGAWQTSRPRGSSPACDPADPALTHPASSE